MESVLGGGIILISTKLNHPFEVDKALLKWKYSHLVFELCSNLNNNSKNED